LSAGVAGYAVRERARSLDARLALADHGREVERLQTVFDDRNTTAAALEAGVRQCEQTLARYGIPADRPEVIDGWDNHLLVRPLADDDRAALRRSFGELFYLMASAAARQAESADPGPARATAIAEAERWNQAAKQYAGDKLARSVRAQRADLARLAGVGDAGELAREAGDTQPVSARDRYLLGYWYHRGGKYQLALPELIAATTEDPRDFSAWFVRGVAHMAVEQPDQAAQCLTACVALRPDFAPVWRNRGLAFARMRQFAPAINDYDKAISIDSTRADVHYLRAGALAELGRHREAVDGYTRALACADCPVRVYSFRSHSWSELGDKDRADADRAEANRREPTDAMSWLARAEGRVESEPKAALEDVDRALAINPELVDALQLRAHLLSERLNRPEDAERTLTKAIDLYPEHVPVRAGRAVQRARAGNRVAAHSDAEFALARDSRGPNLYQIGCVYALTAKQEPADRFKAVELITAALKAGFGREYVDSDPDLNPIRGSEEFRKLLSGLPREKE
jgi:tetratricopeptide (TPR) repeat protein